MNRTTKPLIIYHADCLDGFGAAWLLGRMFEHEKFAAKHGTAPPYELISGREVWIVDFCYPAEHLERIVDTCKQLTVLDHHQTARGHLAAVFSIAKFPSVAQYFDNRYARSAVIDENHSGVGLVAELVGLHGQSVPWFVHHIEDRDLWRFKLPNTRDICAAISARPRTDNEWDALAHEGRPALLLEGQAINRYRNQLVDSIVANAWQDYCGWSDGWSRNTEQIWRAACPGELCSEVASALAARTPHLYAFTYEDLPDDKRRFSLRSVTGTGTDVAKLAERLGGGGHKHAAGFVGSRGRV